MRVKKRIIFIIISVFVFLGILIWIPCSCRVYFSVDKAIGFIFKNEQENVEAYIGSTIYNGTWKEQTVCFVVDGGVEYSKGLLKEEIYEVTNIKIVSGDGQVDLENMTLSIPSREEVTFAIEAKNIYVGEDYQGEVIFFRREPPEISFVIVN